MIKQTDYHKSNPKTSAFHEIDLYPRNAKCTTGELTPIGATQHVRNGQFLQKRYIDALGLFTSDMKLEDQLLVRSTTWSRTFQSAVALLYGFLPQFDMSQLAFETADGNPMCNANSVVSCNCLSIERFKDTMASTQGQFTPRVMADRRTRTTYESIADIFKILPSQLPRPSQIYDVSLVHVCHHQFLPGTDHHQCMPSWTMANIYDIINENGRSQVTTAQYQRLVRLKMYPLLTEIQQHMLKVVKGESSVKFMLFSGHDSTIEPLAAALNISDGHWPRYASRIIIELYTKPTTSSKESYFRVLYDGKVVTHLMYFCQGRMKDHTLGLCPLEHFQQFITVDFLRDFGHEGDYTKLCKIFT